MNNYRKSLLQRAVTYTYTTTYIHTPVRARAHVLLVRMLSLHL